MQKNKSAILQGLAGSMCAGSEAHRGRNFTNLKTSRVHSGAEDKCQGQIYCIKSTVLDIGQVLVKQDVVSFIQK